jgi:hypothetical protein
MGIIPVVPLRLLLTGCVAVLAVLGASAAPAQAATTKNLWATVNICDSEKHPDDIGVAARMPGDGSDRRMYMRFLVQYREDKQWKYVKSGGDSNWIAVGSARYAWVEQGYTFTFDPPAAGTSFIMRGLVKYEWRNRKTKKVERRTHRTTVSGHETKKADPKGYSAARCTLTGPPAEQPPVYQNPVP